VAGPTLVRETGPYGNGLLTRLPVLDRRRIDLSVDSREPRGAIDVDLEVRGQRLRVIATHLGLRWRERRRQRTVLAGSIAGDDGPLVLLGDLNHWWPLAGRQELWPGLVSVRPLRTYPSRLPLLPLDRVLVRPAGILREISAVRTELSICASDHLPVRAVLDLREARQSTAASYFEGFTG
jgi:endonuclease/exonuclease/phosphatase family metal-dependent hydrolase